MVAMKHDVLSMRPLVEGQLNHALHTIRSERQVLSQMLGERNKALRPLRPLLTQVGEPFVAHSESRSTLVASVFHG